MKSKHPSDLKIAYPRNRAKPGTKAAKQQAARAAGLKTFLHTCPKHGPESHHSTHGNGNCRQCIAESMRAAKARRKAAKAQAAMAETMVAVALASPVVDPIAQYLAAVAAKRA
ncbi:putative HicB family RNase H-like nuclease [Paraburkholderia sp. GAS41]